MDWSVDELEHGASCELRSAHVVCRIQSHIPRASCFGTSQTHRRGVPRRTRGIISCNRRGICTCKSVHTFCGAGIAFAELHWPAGCKIARESGAAFQKAARACRCSHSRTLPLLEHMEHLIGDIRIVQSDCIVEMSEIVTAGFRGATLRESRGSTGEPSRSRYRQTIACCWSPREAAFLCPDWLCVVSHCLRPEMSQKLLRDLAPRIHSGRTWWSFAVGAESFCRRGE